MAKHTGINRRVYFLLKKYKGGLFTSEIIELLDLEPKQVDNAIYQLKIRDEIRKSTDGKWKVYGRVPKRWL